MVDRPGQRGAGINRAGNGHAGDLVLSGVSTAPVAELLLDPRCPIKAPIVIGIDDRTAELPFRAVIGIVLGSVILIDIRPIEVSSPAEINAMHTITESPYGGRGGKATKKLVELHHIAGLRIVFPSMAIKHE